MPYYPPLLDQSGLASATDLASLQALVNSLSPLGPYTVATLPTPSASNLLRLATVTDLFGTRTSRVRCEKDGSYYFWQPSSSDSAGSMTITGSATLYPLTSPQNLLLNGTVPAGTTSYTLSPIGGWPGCIKVIRFVGTLIGTLNILGTGLGSGVAMLAGATKSFMLDFSSGTPTWVQIG